MIGRQNRIRCGLPGSDVVVAFDAQNQIMLQHVLLSDLSASDFVST